MATNSYSQFREQAGRIYSTGEANSATEESPNYVWKTSDRIGGGSFGDVYKGRHRSTNRPVAIKVFTTSEVRYRENFDKLRKLDSPYIIKYLAEEKVVDSEREILVMELADENVRDELRKPGNRLGIPKETFLVLFDHCVKALQYLDTRKIAHRDLKPDNILICKQPNLTFKLSDFGLSQSLAATDASMHTILGTPDYMPTGLINNLATNSASGQYTKDEFDIWSAVCCFFECSTGHRPFVPRDCENYLAAINDLYRNRPADIVSAHFDPEKRAYAYQTDLPEQHESYSGSFRQILCKFFKMMFNKDKAFLKMAIFSTICKEIISTKRYSYYFFNNCSVEEHYDTSSSQYFPRQTFEGTVLQKGRDLHMDGAGKTILDEELKIFDGFSKSIPTGGGKFNPADYGCSCVAALIPAKNISRFIPKAQLDSAMPFLVVLCDSAGDTRRIIENGTQVYVAEKKGESLLNLACEEGNYLIASYLIVNGADINVRSQNGATPLMNAVRKQKNHIVELLLELAANTDAIDAAGCSALHYAVRFKNSDAANLLLKYKADINLRNNCGCAPLHIACENNDHSTAKYLIQNGANVNARDEHGVTPLMVSIMHKDGTITGLLLNSGAEVNILARDDTSAIHLAVKRRDLDLLKLLKSKGADLCLMGKHGLLPLHLACKVGDLPIVKYLIDNRAEVNAINSSGVSPLMVAVKNGCNNIARQLLMKGAQVDQLSFEGSSALHYAAASGNIDGVRLLVKKGAKLTPVNQYKATPLHYACGHGSISVGELQWYTKYASKQ